MVKKKFKSISLSVKMYNDLKSEKDKCESWDDTMIRLIGAYRSAQDIMKMEVNEDNNDSK